MSRPSETVGAANEYGPATLQVTALLARVDAFDEGTWSEMARAYRRTRGRGEHRLSKMARDYAWTQFHAGRAEAGLLDEFDVLWEHVRRRPWFNYPGHPAVSDAVSATMLTGHVGRLRTFSRPYFDTLLAPWRAVVEGCVRSRVALSMMSAWPHPADELWPVVDAALSNP